MEQHYFVEGGVNDIVNRVVSECNIQKVSKTYESHSKLPQTSYDVLMPKIKDTKEKICENCDKEDVCKYKEECTKAVKDILDIESRTNVFINTKINCKKWSKKSSEVVYR